MKTIVNKPLTPKEAAVLQLLASGKLYKEIAVVQSISRETVKKHSQNIYKKMNVRNRNEAASIYYQELQNKKTQ